MTKEEQLSKMRMLLNVGWYWRVSPNLGTWYISNDHNTIKVGELSSCFTDEKEALCYLMSEEVDRKTWTTTPFERIQRRATQLGMAQLIPVYFITASKTHRLQQIEIQVKELNKGIARLELAKSKLLEEKEQI